MDMFSVLAKTVVFLFAGSPPMPIGTGFVVGYPHPTVPGAVVPIVVTAKHVVAGQAKVLGRFSAKGGHGTGFIEYDLVRLRSEKDYWEHPDPGVDIVAFRTIHSDQADYEFLPLDLVATPENLKAEDVAPTDRVLFPGLLVQFFGSTQNYPVMRDGSVALLPGEPIPLKIQMAGQIIETSQPLLLLNAISVQGASGSPVFLSPRPRMSGNSFVLGAKPYLLGVMHGFYNALPREVIQVPTSARSLYAENSGIAIVFPAWRLREILDSDSVKNRIGSLPVGPAPR